MKRVAVAAAVIIGLALAGCGGSEPSQEDQVREVAESFAVAIGSEDFGKSCDLLSSEYRANFEMPEFGSECKDMNGPGVWGNPLYKGLSVAGVSVDDDQANVTFQDSPVSLSLTQDEGGWLISDIR